MRRVATALTTCTGLLISALCLFAHPLAAADATPVGSAEQEGGKLRAEVLSLKRTEGETLTVRFTIINDGGAALSMRMAGPAGGTLAEIKLVDLVNRRSYFPGEASSDSCDAEAGKRVTCWAIFAAPPASLKSINVKLKGFDLLSAPISN